MCGETAYSADAPVAVNRNRYASLAQQATFECRNLCPHRLCCSAKRRGNVTRDQAGVGQVLYLPARESGVGRPNMRDCAHGPSRSEPDEDQGLQERGRVRAWLRANHARETEIWLRIYKKGAGKPTVTNAQALDVALCWGWIDGIRKAFDDESFLQRYTPRRARSIWSQINREHVARLTAAGRMKPPGQRQVDAARADGRWDAAYAPMRAATEASIPDDLRAAIDADPRARRTFRTCQLG